ncbi:MAG TPA: hypothetical protein VLM79_23690 [Kofleriaceae bacterium]|nr:hypothetical protein [Kofleriaceae bacterium]
MSKVSLRNLLSKLTAIAALSTPAAGASAAAGAPVEPAREPPATDEPGRGSAAEWQRGVVDADDTDLDPALQIDREQLDGPAAAAALGRSLALALAEVRPLSATYLAASWSLSVDPLRRQAVAHALEWAFPLVGDALVIDHLSHDADPAIRAAVARAAWARRHTGGDPGVLERLSGDPDPAVRAVATSARPS